jgi:O-glycosyl hydrolase
VFEAESGVLGSDWAVSNSPSPAYITINTDGTGNNPGSASRVSTYTLTFPAAGTYQLYARIRVGAGGASDDSLFYASSFGTKNPTLNSDWILANGLASVGFSNSTDVVTGGGSLGTGMWKWINLSQFTSQSGFTVSAGNLAQTFQIGARENGLSIDKFVFGTAANAFTVADLDSGAPGTPSPTIDPTKTFQTIEGLGGATAFYAGWVKDHPYKQEIYTNAFAGLNISMLRLGNWWRNPSTFNFDSAATDIVSNANRLLSRPISVYMSSWAPPAPLKSNGQVGNGGSLLYTNGNFVYNEFAQYWSDSLLAYRSNGVSPTWISMQNEPDFSASYDSCVFHTAEDMSFVTNTVTTYTTNGSVITTNTTTTITTNRFASYTKALDTVYQRLTNLPSPPKLLAPECVHIAFNDLPNYAATLNSNNFYGVAYHLYGDGNDSAANSFVSNLRSSTNIFATKPHFMTEYGISNQLESATLIHDCLTHGMASGYNYWSLVWPGVSGGLVQIENPYDGSRASWTNAPPGTPTQSHGWWLARSYWSMKHFSYFVQPGFRRVAASWYDTNVLTSAFLSPDGTRLAAVFINRNASTASVSVVANAFPVLTSAVYQTAGTNNWQSLGAAGAQVDLPPSSLTTVVLEKFVALGSASNPSPNVSATNVPVNIVLNWTPGSNALTHTLYLGTSSNGVAQATTTSPEFRGTLSNNFFNASLFGNTTYFWRVDEIAGANTNAGSVWTFTTAPPPALAHRYSFNEMGGTTVSDSIGGPSWTGTVLNGGTLSGGQLALAAGAPQYANLPAGIVSTLSNFTIEVWVKLFSSNNWTRIFDFGANTSTNMFLTPQNGSNTRLRFSITTNGAGGERQITGTSALTTGVWHHVVVTLNGNTGILYLNGAAVGTNTGVNVRPLHLGNTVNNYLGKSQYSDPYVNGLLDEFRIYTVALSPSEIAATYAMGPNQLLSTNSPTIAATSISTNLALTWPLASAGFTLQSRTNLVLGNWVNVTSPAPQLIGSQWQLTIPATNPGSIFFRISK